MSIADTFSADTNNPPPTTSSGVHELSDDIGSVHSQLGEELSVVETNAAVHAATPATTTADATARVEPPAVPAEYQVGQLRFSMPPPASDSMTATISARQAYDKTWNLNKF